MLSMLCKRKNEIIEAECMLYMVHVIVFGEGIKMQHITDSGLFERKEFNYKYGNRYF